jgi:hypothetical protein
LSAETRLIDTDCVGPSWVGWSTATLALACDEALTRQGCPEMRRAHRIMHFTHVDNLPGVLAAGCLLADSLVDRSSALRVEAADLDIKADRKRMRVPLAPHGCVADYVPFYFAPRSPMLYKLHKGGVPNYKGGQDPLVYLVSSAEAVVAGASFVFSDGNCASAVTQFASDLAQIESVVDWEVMNATMWANTADDPDRKRRRMAEFLVHQRVPLGRLSGIVVRRDTMKAQVNKLLASNSIYLPVRTQPSWYF